MCLGDVSTCCSLGRVSSGTPTDVFYRIGWNKSHRLLPVSDTDGSSHEVASGTGAKGKLALTVHTPSQIG